MANTYTQLYIQFVFAVKNREALIMSDWKDELYKYITGIVENKDSKMLSINGIADHVHMFIGYKPSISIPNLIKDVKLASNSLINGKRLTSKQFGWQDGYGAFSYSRSHIDSVCKYIINQELYHKKVTFRDEYTRFLRKFEIDYEQKYLFDFFD